MRRPVAAIAAALLSASLLAGCGGSSSSTASDSLPTKVIDITFTGDSVTPNGELVEVAVGQRIELDVTADKPGEIHVHSSPEQELPYDNGSSTLTVSPIKAPGVITVESHDLNKVILKLQAR